MEEASSVPGVEDRRFQQVVELQVEVWEISEEGQLCYCCCYCVIMLARCVTAAVAPSQLLLLDSQVVLVDEDKEAVEGQQADGAPCGTTHRAVTTVTLTELAKKRSKVGPLTHVVGGAQEVEQQRGAEEVRQDGVMEPHQDLLVEAAGQLRSRAPSACVCVCVSVRESVCLCVCYLVLEEHQPHLLKGPPLLLQSRGTYSTW